MGPPWIVIFQEKPMNAQLHLNQGNCEARLTPEALCHVTWTVPEQLFWCIVAHCPASGNSQ